MGTVNQISTGRHAGTGKWWASCYSKMLGRFEQWGETEREAVVNLQKFVKTQGETWPPIERNAE